MSTVEAIHSPDEPGKEHFEVEVDRRNVGRDLDETAEWLQRKHDEESADGKVVTGVYQRNHDSDPAKLVLGGKFEKEPDGYVAPKRVSSDSDSVADAQELQKQATQVRSREAREIAEAQGVDTSEFDDGEYPLETQAEYDYDPRETTEPTTDDQDDRVPGTGDVGKADDGAPEQVAPEKSDKERSKLVPPADGGDAAKNS